MRLIIKTLGRVTWPRKVELTCAPSKIAATIESYIYAPKNESNKPCSQRTPLTCFLSIDMGLIKLPFTYKYPYWLCSDSVMVACIYCIHIQDPHMYMHSNVNYTN